MKTINRRGTKVRYDWLKIGRYAKTHTVRECCKHFGFVISTWCLAVKKGKIKPKPHRKTLPILKKLLVKNSSYNPACLKAQVIKHKLIPNNNCAVCDSLPIWNKKPLVFRLDHINGINNDNRLSNLRFVCPNCDSQLPTFCGRNR